MLVDLISDLHTHRPVHSSICHTINILTTPAPMRKRERGDDSMWEPQHIRLAPSPADSPGTGEIIPTFTAPLPARANNFSSC